jgi:hypothetical protein
MRRSKQTLDVEKYTLSQRLLGMLIDVGKSKNGEVFEKYGVEKEQMLSVQ